LTIDWESCLALTMSAVESGSGISSIRPSWHSMAVPVAAAWACLEAHGGVQIDADHASLGANEAGSDDRIQPRSASQVEYRFARLQIGPLVRIPDAGEGGHRSGGCVVQPFGIISEPFRSIPAVEEVELTLRMFGNLLVHADDFVLQDCF